MQIASIGEKWNGCIRGRTSPSYEFPSQDCHISRWEWGCIEQETGTDARSIQGQTPKLVKFAYFRGGIGVIIIWQHLSHWCFDTGMCFRWKIQKDGSEPGVKKKRVYLKLMLLSNKLVKLQACQELHKIGELNDHLLPVGKVVSNVVVLGMSLMGRTFLFVWYCQSTIYYILSVARFISRGWNTKLDEVLKLLIWWVVIRRLFWNRIEIKLYLWLCTWS